jgi:hypothetical protein
VKRSRFTKIVADLSLEPFTFHGADVVELLERVRNQLDTQRPCGWIQAQRLSRDLDLWTYHPVSHSTSRSPVTRPTS